MICGYMLAKSGPPGRFRGRSAEALPGQVWKNSMYEGSERVALVVAGPGVPRGVADRDGVGEAGLQHGRDGGGHHEWH